MFSCPVCALESLGLLVLGKILHTMEVWTVYDPVTIPAKFTRKSVGLLPPSPAGLHLIPGLARPPDLVPGLMSIGLVVPITTPALGKIATSWTILAGFKCLACGLMFCLMTILSAHMAKIAVRASIAPSFSPVTTHLPDDTV